MLTCARTRYATFRQMQMVVEGQRLARVLASTIGGATMPIPRLPLLIAHKLTVNEPKDHDDVKLLEEAAC